MSTTLLERVRALPRPSPAAMPASADLIEVEERLQLDGEATLATGALVVLLADPETACGVLALYRGDDVLVERAASLQGAAISDALLLVLDRAEALERPLATDWPPRVRFNMGFHDGTQSAFLGWENRARDPEWVRTHPDLVYVHGYRQGHQAMAAGGLRPSASTAAWSAFRVECQEVAAEGAAQVLELVPLTTRVADDVLRDPSPH